MVRVYSGAGGAVAIVELHDPERSNTLSGELAEDLAAAAQSIKLQGGIRAIVLQGAGIHFSAGGNPYQMQREREVPLAARANSIAAKTSDT